MSGSERPERPKLVEVGRSRLTRIMYASPPTRNQRESPRGGVRGVDCGVASPRCPAVLTLKPAGQIARIVYEIRQLAGLEGITSVV